MFLTFSLSLIYMKLREFTTSVKHGEIKLLMLISNSSEFFSCAFLLLLYIVVKPQRIKIAFACTRWIFIQKRKNIWAKYSKDRLW